MHPVRCRGEYANRDILGLITVKPNEQLRFKLKAYSTNEDTEIKEGTTSKEGNKTAEYSLNSG